MTIEELTNEITRINDARDEAVSKQEAAQRQLDGALGRLDRLETTGRARDPLSHSYIFSKIITGTTSASAGTETTHTHTLNRDPSFVFITSQSNGVVYLTSKSKDDIKVKGSASSLNFTAYLLV